MFIHRILLIVFTFVFLLVSCERAPQNPQPKKKIARTYDLGSLGGSKSGTKTTTKRGEKSRSFSQGSPGQCVINQLQKPKPVRKDWENTNTLTDYYALAVSWSPQFCSKSGSRKRAPFQCVANQFQFVVHGLWPQSSIASNKFGHPRRCKDSELLSDSLIRKHVCTVPGAQLMQSQWVKHGSCAFDEPEKYFDKIETLWAKLKKPDMSKLNANEVTVEQILESFVKVNAGTLKKTHMKVWLNGKGYLREVVICYDKYFDYKECELKGAPNSQMVKIKLQ